MFCIWGSKSLLYGFSFAFVLSFWVTVHGQNIWPMPVSASSGHRTLYLSSNFELGTYGSNYSDSSGILKEAFERMVHVIKGYHTPKANFPDSDIALNTDGDMFARPPVLAGINISVHSTNDTAATVFGAFHALETFSQLCYFNFATKALELHSAPWTIYDQPRFPYRGLLIGNNCRYAERRGVNVLAEIDVPGHTTSWGIGYPSLWPSNGCRNPLDVTNEFAFEIIDGILSDFSKVFKFKFVHLGGDEVYTDCWKTTPHITEWEETFNNFGDKLSNKTVVHTWLGKGVAQKVVAAGLRCIISNQKDQWYLDHVEIPWQRFYDNEPLTNIMDPDQQKLVLGGEACMWGEKIDTSNIQRTIWPRAAAVAERLWTPFEKLAKNATEVTSRLAHFRCLLNQRGIQASPLDGHVHHVPKEPGSCINQ
ncbi:hypothetical protein LUZ61_011934 [Rhynchospora tenuis]|uniref:beta-N-acetylhexosaminidase n=1 Tax=Rhynchospora tenuis TaxID=198213 RepID=A0AAD6A1Y6_9POAL|nr:hypothetical protein LUZ61_011934 [Rhynchospora tenuis]